ncbi:response regulator transcription factor [Sulfurospirillum sp. T05]|uniref:Response regulator transcription factor n=1 Tax=Sulfurospirillum tamanense TaxID=2813362 RepID=A0ABS2WQE2_9BACT|nr:response regulator transcription factor [Sulfurospirillum tamanensis]MBN2963859.1 response regulator transcription factor [Sulfurospirillum tamanensis]
MKILLLEDEMMLCRTLEEYLRDLGHHVVGANDGESALEYLGEQRFDLLIFDINVPSLSGLELAERIQSLGVVTPVIFISAMIDIEKISQAFALGAADYLKKPFHLKELGLRIDKIKREVQAKNPNHVILSEGYGYLKEEEQLYFHKTPVNLTKKQRQILTLLCENIDTIVDFERFRSYVWNDEPVDNATIRAEISRFRKLLKEDFIVNIKGIGYKVSRYYRQN